MHSHFGAISTMACSFATLNPTATAPRCGTSGPTPSPKPGWRVTWQIEDRYRILPEGAKVRLRYTDLTTVLRLPPPRVGSRPGSTTRASRLGSHGS